MCLALGINILRRLLQAALMVNVSYTLTMTFAIRGELSQFKFPPRDREANKRIRVGMV